MIGLIVSDLNLTENLWALMKQKVHDICTPSRDSTATCKEWEELCTIFLAADFGGVLNGFMECIRRKGNPTKY